MSKYLRLDDVAAGNPLAEQELQRYEALLAAAMLTLKNNGHLCDGDDCTLKELREAVEAIGTAWGEA